jgi:hypothetical protein
VKYGWKMNASPKAQTDRITKMTQNAAPSTSKAAESQPESTLKTAPSYHGSTTPRKCRLVRAHGAGHAAQGKCESGSSLHSAPAKNCSTKAKKAHGADQAGMVKPAPATATAVESESGQSLKSSSAKHCSTTTNKAPTGTRPKDPARPYTVTCTVPLQPVERVNQVYL